MPVCFATIRPRNDAFSGTMLFVVTSPAPMSSASARRMLSMMSAGRDDLFGRFLSKPYSKALPYREQNIAIVLRFVAGKVRRDDSEHVITGRELRRVPRAALCSLLARAVGLFVPHTT